MKKRNKAGLLKRTALIMSALFLFASLVAGVFVFLNGDADVAEAYDGEGTVTIRNADANTVAEGHSTIAALGRSGKNWRTFEVSGISGQVIFCLNSDKTMNNGDTMSYTVYTATDFAKKVSGGSNLAKATTYWNKTISKGSISGLSSSQTWYAVHLTL